MTGNRLQGALCPFAFLPIFFKSLFSRRPSCYFQLLAVSSADTQGGGRHLPPSHPPRQVD